TSRARIVTYHGPVAVSTFDDFTVEYFRRTLFLPEGYVNPWNLQVSECEVIAPGIACGPLIGGNLSLLVSLLGTLYEPDTRGAVLFLEDIGEEPYRVDRMLTQLLLAGKLQHCVAVLVGRFRAPWGRGQRSSGIGWQPPLRDILRERLGGLGIPVLASLPLGHVRSKLTLPLGVWAEVNTSTCTIRLVEPSIADEVS
ncbi:MAG: LD-carboxypeptidase, partial [Candidatus Kapabacteria bacterium]|nr:LD-carboxypeptidase [Candidatus Kapabacteria bacterium]